MRRQRVTRCVDIYATFLRKAFLCLDINASRVCMNPHAAALLFCCFCKIENPRAWRDLLKWAIGRSFGLTAPPVKPKERPITRVTRHALHVTRYERTAETHHFPTLFVLFLLWADTGI